MDPLSQANVKAILARAFDNYADVEQEVAIKRYVNLLGTFILHGRRNHDGKNNRHESSRHRVI